MLCFVFVDSMMRSTKLMHCFHHAILNLIAEYADDGNQNYKKIVAVEGDDIQSSMGQAGQSDWSSGDSSDSDDSL